MTIILKFANSNSGNAIVANLFMKLLNGLGNQKDVPHLQAYLTLLDLLLSYNGGHPSVVAQHQNLVNKLLDLQTNSSITVKFAFFYFIFISQKRKLALDNISSICVYLSENLIGNILTTQIGKINEALTKQVRTFSMLIILKN